MARIARNSNAVIYLARGADEKSASKFDNFIRSYRRYPAGEDHKLYIILKGFPSSEEKIAARDKFKIIGAEFIELEDHRYDVGAYIDACLLINEDIVCFFNTHAEILSSNWLKYFNEHLRRKEVGLVGASGSFECLQLPGFKTQKFPNPHLRSNGFALQRTMLLSLFEHYHISSKSDAYAFESGGTSITRRVTALGYDVLVVGRNGRGYPPVWWPASDTFRQGRQSNLLVADNQTQRFEAAEDDEKRMLFNLAWGSQVNIEDTLPNIRDPI